ncbi:MAG: ribosome biogenesis GTPase Der [Candidatus Dormibacteria bacterium]
MSVERLPLVAIVGRPNVGKSTLFNRIIGRRQALVDPEAGLTRDRLFGHAEWRGRTFILVDTAGLTPGLPDGPGDLTAQIEVQTAAAIEEADLIVFLCDVRAGLTAVDRDVATRLRRSRQPVILAGNKAESPKDSYLGHELLELGFDGALFVSALKGVGVDDLLDRVLEQIPAGDAADDVNADVRVAIMGRPNVGKSSLLNRIAGSERVVVSEVPGTTRDPIDTLVAHGGRSVLLVDTAGIRRRGVVQTRVEKYSLLRGLKAMERSDVVLLMMDAHQGVTAQDRHVAGYAAEAGKGVVLLLNKWDLLEGEAKIPDSWRRLMAREFDFLAHTTWVPVSAKTGRGVDRALDEALKVSDERRRRIPTRQLMAALEEAMGDHPPPSFRGKRLEVRFATQAAGLPPTFVLFVNDDGLLHFSYRRFLENRLRERFGFDGTPVRLVLRERAPRQAI